MKKIVMVTRDVGPGNALRIVAERLRKEGHEVQCFLGRPMPDRGSHHRLLVAIAREIDHANVVLVGISSKADGAVEERFAFDQAMRRGIRRAIFSDIYGAFNRPWITHLLPHSDILFVTDEQEMGRAALCTGLRTVIYASGNPYWGTFFDAPVSRDEVRERLGVKADEKMILVGGAKELERNVSLFSDVVMAAREYNIKLNLVLTMHPGADHSQDAYKGILKWSKHPIRFAGKETGMNTQTMLAGADLVVSGGSSTVSIMAACQHKPVVDVMRTLDFLYWEELSGLDFWPPASSGASWLARHDGDMRDAMLGLLDMGSEARARQRKVQDMLYTPSKFENAAAVIAEALVS